VKFLCRENSREIKFPVSPQVCNAVAYGGLFCVCPAFLSERFGKAGFGYNFGMMTLALAIGNTGLTQLSAALYDSHADADHHCFGKVCFHVSFEIYASLNAVAVLLGAALAQKEKRKPRPCEIYSSLQHLVAGDAD
jgi:hypothetical protein